MNRRLFPCLACLQTTKEPSIKTLEICAYALHCVALHASVCCPVGWYCSKAKKEEKNKMMSTGEEEKMMMMMMVPRWLMMGREKKEALTPEVLREVTLET